MKVVFSLSLATRIYRIGTCESRPVESVLQEARVYIRNHFAVIL
jgi:hypothetical protein